MKNFENVPKCLPIKTYSFLVLKERIEEKEQFHSYIITYGKIDSLNEKRRLKRLPDFKAVQKTS